MTRKKCLGLVIGAAILLCLSLPSPGQGRFKGNLLFGFRFVETSGPGVHSKYKEDINLRGGPRLQSFSLAYSPENGFRRWLDRLDFRITHFGGDPFESLAVGIQKYGRYTMKYERKKATYFYEDLHRPGDGSLYDLHTFGFERVVDAGSARVSLTKKVDILLSFDRFSRTGHSRTTQDIERVEFELEKPVNEEAKEIAVGLNIHSSRYSLLFEERKRDFRSENSLFLPGYADGGAGAIYPSSLDYYFLNQPFRIASFLHTLRITARPFDDFLFTGRAILSQDDVDVDYSERASGINYLGRIYDYAYSGQGTFDRDVQMYELDMNYLFRKRLSLVVATRYHKFDQSGKLAAGEETGSLDMGYDTLAFDGGLQALVTAGLSVTLGYRHETRQLEGWETATFEFETRRQGYFGNVKWDWRRLGLTLDYERGVSKEPFTLMSATDFDRIRWTGQYCWKSFRLSGIYLWQDSKGEVFEQGFSSSRHQLGLRGGYQGSKVQASAGYSHIAVTHQASRSVFYPPFWTGPSGTFDWQILYEGKSRLLDASLAVHLREGWKLGLYGNAYANKGSWEIRRVTLKAYLEITLQPGYVAGVAYRYIDFKEKSSGFNDYRASLVELSFGYHWQ